MPRITSKGQVTIPQDIRTKFALLPGVEVDFINTNNQVLIVKSKLENKFLKWLGKGKIQTKGHIDNMVDQLRGKTDE